MKTLPSFIAILLILSVPVIGVFAKNIQKTTQKSTPKRFSKLSTDINFNDRVVGGKYQYSTESVTTVENDKSLDDLIGVRKNFKDRIERSQKLR